MNRALIAALALCVVYSVLGQSPAKIRITTWNLEWFPNGSPHETAPEKQAQRIDQTIRSAVQRNAGNPSVSKNTLSPVPSGAEMIKRSLELQPATPEPYQS